MGIKSARNATTIADFLSARTQILLLRNEETRKSILITGLQSNIVNIKESRDSFPVYQLSLMIEFYKDSKPEETNVIDIFGKQDFYIKELDPKCVIGILEKINTNEAFNREHFGEPCLIYIGSETAFLIESDPVFTKYGISISVKFCDAEAFDGLTRMPTTAENLAKEINPNFEKENMDR